MVRPTESFTREPLLVLLVDLFFGSLSLTFVNQSLEMSKLVFFQFLMPLDTLVGHLLVRSMGS